jgi:hypothetical protein
MLDIPVMQCDAENADHLVKVIAFSALCYASLKFSTPVYYTGI